jgi:hypothetical protein
MNIKHLSSAFVIILPLYLNATISLEVDAKRLFLPEKMNDHNILMRGEYIDFCNRINACESAKLRSHIERTIVNAITSIVVSVSTNYVNDNIGANVLKSRTEYFKKISFKCISTNECMSLANYLNNVQLIQYPSDLVFARLNIHRYRSEVITNSLGEVKQVFKGCLNRKIHEEKKLQVRVYNANKEIDEFRKLIISICGQGIFASRKTMSDEEFPNFTNRVVRLSRASEKEQKILFQKLNEELRSHNKKRNR